MSTRPTTMGVLVLAAAMGGCGEYATADRNLEYDPLDSGTEAQSGTLRLDIFPGMTVDADGEIRALPQTLLDIDTTPSGRVDLGNVDLLGPGTISGVVTGASVTPWADSAQVPSSEGSVPATVHLTLPGTIQSYTARTDENGFYEAIVTPSTLDRYDVAVIPDDPTIPFASRTRTFRSIQEVMDLHLDYGVALYGRVLTGAGDPVPGVSVWAIDGVGTRSSATSTDAGGWYVLRVEEDASYQVVSGGRDHGRDPVLTSAPVQAEPDLGGRVDFTYEALSGPFATGRLVDGDGFGVPDATVRFIATALDGYPTEGWELIVDDTTDANGNFGTALVAGTYTVQFLPALAPDPTLGHGSVELTEVRAGSGDLALGNQVLPSLELRTGEVVDPAGNTVAGARVTCTEVDAGQRSWSTYTRKSGVYEIYLPPAPVRCQVQPPGALAADLAWTTEQIDAAIDDGHQFELREGTLVTGRVRLNGAGEAYALVEVRDDAGGLLGSALTAGGEDGAGEFVLRVDLSDGAR